MKKLIETLNYQADETIKYASFGNINLSTGEAHLGNVSLTIKTDKDVEEMTDAKGRKFMRLLAVDSSNTAVLTLFVYDYKSDKQPQHDLRVSALANTAIDGTDKLEFFGTGTVDNIGLNPSNDTMQDETAVEQAVDEAI